MIRLVILGIPQPKQSARFRAFKSGDKTFVTSYQKKEVVQNERNIKFDVMSQLPAGFVPYDCPIAMEVKFVFPAPASWSKKKLLLLESGAVIYKDTKPDLDNLKKSLFDAMEGVVFVNDSRICKISSEKFYGKQPRIEATITPISIPVTVTNVQNGIVEQNDLFAA